MVVDYVEPGIPSIVGVEVTKFSHEIQRQLKEYLAEREAGLRESIAKRIEAQTSEIVPGVHSGALKAALERSAAIARGQA